MNVFRAVFAYHLQIPGSPITQAATHRAEGKAEAQECWLGGLSSSSHQQLQVMASEQENIH